MTDALESHLHDQIDHSDRFFWHRLRWRVLKSHLPAEPFELVDVGAGAGHLGQYMARDFPKARYRFVEPIESLRTHLRATYGRGADAGDTDVFDGAQFVTLLDVLEHQADDGAFMKQLVGRMTPGSTLMLTVPAMTRLWSGWDVALGHYRRYDKETLLGAVEGLDLEVHDLNYLFPELIPLGLARARRRGSRNVPAGDLEADLPELPWFVNEPMYGLGLASLKLRRRWHFGTSLFLLASAPS